MLRRVRPRINKINKKTIEEKEEKEDAVSISALQKFRRDVDTKAKVNPQKSTNPSIEIKNDTVADNVAKDEINEHDHDASPKQSVKSLKRQHMTVEFDQGCGTSRDDTPVVNKKNNNLLTVWEPDNWKEIIENLRIMRLKKDAPVDTMGCHMAADNNADDVTKRFHFLVALMLSSQTKDQVTFEAMQRLIKLPGGLTVQTIHEIAEQDLAAMLHPVGFYKTKAKHIKKTVEMLKDKFNSDIPKTSTDLCKLPGVGPKMAHICMQVAWNEISGIGVDTHVHRISNRLGWVQKTTKTPEETRLALERWLPKEWWADVNTMMVGLGQTICKPIKPNCGECLNKSLCPVGQGKKKA